MSQPKRRTVLAAHVEFPLEKASSHDEALSYLALLICPKTMSQPNRRTVLASRVESRRGSQKRRSRIIDAAFLHLKITHLFSTFFKHPYLYHIQNTFLYLEITKQTTAIHLKWQSSLNKSASSKIALAQRRP